MDHTFRLNRPPWMRTGAVIVVIMLMLFDFKVAFHRAGQPPGAVALSLVNSQAQAGNPYMAAYGSKFVAVRSDMWNCYRLRENVSFNFGIITIPDRCQDHYIVVVQTESCKPTTSETIECTSGTWRWVPNPPCGSDSPTGWYLPPC